MNKFNKYLLIAVAVLLLTACDYANNGRHEVLKFNEVTTWCINNVTYYHVASSIAPAYSKDGKLISCE